jgi:hypothetical protein
MSNKYPPSTRQWSDNRIRGYHHRTMTTHGNPCVHAVKKPRPDGGCNTGGGQATDNDNQEQRL